MSCACVPEASCACAGGDQGHQAAALDRQAVRSCFATALSSYCLPLPFAASLAAMDMASNTRLLPQ